MSDRTRKIDGKAENDLFLAGFLPAHGVIDMSRVLEKVETRAEVKALSLRRIEGEPLEQPYFVAALAALRGLAMEGSLGADEIHALIAASERMAKIEGLDDVYRTIDALAADPTSASVLPSYIRSKAINGDRTSRWIAFFAASEVLRRGTARIGLDLEESLTEAAASEEEPARREQFDQLLEIIHRRNEEGLDDVPVLLVIDPYELTRYRRLLEARGAAVSTASTFPEAIVKFTVEKPAAVVTDVESGIGLANHIRITLRDATPIIGMAGSTLSEAAPEAAVFSRILRKTDVAVQALPEVVVAELEAANDSSQ